MEDYFLCDFPLLRFFPELETLKSQTKLYTHVKARYNVEIVLNLMLQEANIYTKALHLAGTFAWFLFIPSLFPRSTTGCFNINHL